LNHSSFIWSDKIDSLISCGHDTSGKFLAKSKYLHPNSAYTLYITAEEFARFIIEILKSNEASDNSSSRMFINEMLKPQVDETEIQSRDQSALDYLLIGDLAGQLIQPHPENFIIIVEQTEQGSDVIRNSELMKVPEL
jgi:hypothetical protein